MPGYLTRADPVPQKWTAVHFLYQVGQIAQLVPPKQKRPQRSFFVYIPCQLFSTVSDQPARLPSESPTILKKWYNGLYQIFNLCYNTPTNNAKGAICMHILKGKTRDYHSLKEEVFLRKNTKVGTFDPSLTPLNYSLCQNAVVESDQLDEHIKALGVQRKIRGDAVRFCSLIVDLPKDETGDPKKFFEDSIEGLLNFFEISREDVLYAQVHMDERHPHMHFCFVPLVKTDQKIRLSAKDLVTQEKLRDLHPFMQTYMAEKGHSGTLWHNDEVKRDKKFLEHKLAQLESDISQKQEQVNALDHALQRSHAEISSLNAQKSTLKAEVEHLTAEKKKAEKIDLWGLGYNSGLAEGKKEVERLESALYKLGEMFFSVQIVLIKILNFLHIEPKSLNWANEDLLDIESLSVEDIESLPAVSDNNDLDLDPDLEEWEW